MLLLDLWPLGRWFPSRMGAPELGRLVREKVARTRLGVLLARGGRRTEAVRELEAALRLDPGDREAAGALERLRLGP